MTRQEIEQKMDELAREYYDRTTGKSQKRFLNWRGSFGSGTTEGPHRSAMSKKQPKEYPVTVEIEGKRYTGFYTVSSGIVTVEFDWGERSTQTGPRGAEQTARLSIP